jgi:hypothetical protein
MEMVKKNPRSRVSCNLRDEKSGIRSYFPLQNSWNRQVHFMNKTAVQIFELCDGKNDCEDIARILGTSYPGVDQDTLMQDVKECLRTLKSHEFIDWEEDPNSGDTQAETRLADERDFKKISAFMVRCLSADPKELSVSYLPVGSNAYYNPFFIRTRQFHGSEIYFIAEKEGTVAGVASFVPSSYPLKSAQLGCFAVKETLDGETATGLLQCMSATLKRVGMAKLKCDLIARIDYLRFRDFLLEHRFHVEATLAGETENNEDILIFSLFI